MWRLQKHRLPNQWKPGLQLFDSPNEKRPLGRLSLTYFLTCVSQGAVGLQSHFLPSWYVVQQQQQHSHPLQGEHSLPSQQVDGQH